MYIDDLYPDTVPIQTMYLDPNNPRFWTEREGTLIADSKVPDDKVQERTNTIMEGNHGVNELKESILRNGFLPLDRIVVRPLDGVDGSYVVVEGNRRLCALQKLRTEIDEYLINEEGIDDAYLDRLKESTDNLNVLIYKGGDTHDISWLLQGIRHISGIKDWAPAQRARLVANQVNNRGLGFKEVGQAFGLTAHAVGRLYRAYNALCQMKDDEEFGGKAKNNYFSLFEEVIRKRTVRDWLHWDDNTQSFEHYENLHQFYSWIVPDEDHDEEPRRIDDPKEIKELDYLISGQHWDLMRRIDAHELDIRQASAQAQDAAPDIDWRECIKRAAALLSDIPIEAVESEPVSFIEELEKLQESIGKKRRMAEALKE